MSRVIVSAVHDHDVRLISPYPSLTLLTLLVMYSISWALGATISVLQIAELPHIEI